MTFNRRTLLWPALALLSLSLAAFISLEGFGLFLSLSRASASIPLVAGGKNKRLPTAQEVKARNASLSRQIASQGPRGFYLVIDTGRNLLFIMKGDKVVRQALVSTGSGVVLQDPAGNRKWIFDTPRGEFSVKSKATDPTWVKPDWAFIEEGEPLPKNYQDRMEEGMLGEYALGIGDGYFIHGTLYTRLLGRNVTHGCVRVGDDDLEYVFRNVPMGARVFIF